jgi:Cu/Ag efflux protein CusF
MRAFTVVLVLDLALAVAGGAGWVLWERATARAERARAAATGGEAGEREWRVAAVVRTALPDLGVLVVTHDDIPDVMPSMTMGFRTASPDVAVGVQAGDTVRLTLRGAPPRVVITAVERIR